MKKSVIKELFGEAISYAEKMRVEDEEYYRQLEVAEIKKKELKEGLTENQMEIFEAFLDAEQEAILFTVMKRSDRGYALE